MLFAYARAPGLGRCSHIRRRATSVPDSRAGVGVAMQVLSMEGAMNDRSSRVISFPHLHTRGILGPRWPNTGHVASLRSTILRAIGATPSLETRGPSSRWPNRRSAGRERAERGATNVEHPQRRLLQKIFRKSRPFRRSWNCSLSCDKTACCFLSRTPRLRSTSCPETEEARTRHNRR